MQTTKEFFLKKKPTRSPRRSIFLLRKHARMAEMGLFILERSDHFFLEWFKKKVCQLIALLDI